MTDRDPNLFHVEFSVDGKRIRISSSVSEFLMEKLQCFEIDNPDLLITDVRFFGWSRQ